MFLGKVLQKTRKTKQVKVFATNVFFCQKQAIAYRRKTKQETCLVLLSKMRKEGGDILRRLRKDFYKNFLEKLDNTVIARYNIGK